MARDDGWYKNAIIYCLDIETYQDSDGDGVGDIQGLISRLDYLANLGIDCLWLLPFYPTPNLDDGYDVTDHRAVDPRLGTIGDFRQLVEEATRCGIRLMADLPINHTSVDHRWFQEARSSPKSPYRGFYVWADKPAPDDKEIIVFPGEQESTWTWDDKAGAYYFHHFYEFQPELRIENPETRREMLEIMDFWIQQGVDGFRLDATPFLIEDREDGRERRVNHAYMRQFMDFLNSKEGRPIILAEAGVPLTEVKPYFDDGIQLLFNFALAGGLFLTLARQKADPICRVLEQEERFAPGGCWANFLRHHDELSLELLDPDEREEVFAAFAPEEEMRIYGRGIRRRLAPMLGGDRRRIQMAFSILLSLPGPPIIYYGDEIGMGDDLLLPSRMGLRTPMQWSSEANAGFSTGHDPIRPAIESGNYAYSRINVSEQEARDDSLLGALRRLISLRCSRDEIGAGPVTFADTGNEAVLGLAYHSKDALLVTLHNLTGARQSVKLLAQPSETLYSSSSGPPAESERQELEPYGYRWLMLPAQHLLEGRRGPAQPLGKTQQA